MLFKTSNILKEFAQITGELNFNSVKRTVQSVEDSHIKPAIGKELYNSLNEAYNDAANETLADAPLVALLEKCRAAIGPLFCYYHAPKADVLLSDAGMQRTESSTNKSAYQEQRTHFREANLREGEKAIESLLEFLEDNKADYAEWVSSAAFKKYRSLFIKSGTEFDDLFPSHSPHRNYHAFRSKMQDVEEDIRTFLGDTFFDSLKEKDTAADGELSEKETKLLEKLKKAIANFTVAAAAPFVNVRIDSNGITIMDINTAKNDELAKRGSADANSINALIESCNATGQRYLANAEKYIKENKDDFDTWIGFQDATDEEEEIDMNEDNSTVFGM